MGRFTGAEALRDHLFHCRADVSPVRPELMGIYNYLDDFVPYPPAEVDEVDNEVFFFEEFLFWKRWTTKYVA